MDNSIQKKEDLTIEQVKEAVPKSLKVAVTPQLVNKLNTMVSDPELSKVVQDNFITYSVVLRDGKFKLEDYINAVTFCTYKTMGLTNREAYIKTFPQRYQNLCAKGTANTLDQFVNAYFKNRMVQSILERTIIPFHILNYDARQEALNTQVTLMMTAKSEMVRMKAADSVLAHTEPPQAVGPLLNINMGKSSALEDLEKTISELAKMQKQAIHDKTVTTKDIAEQRIVEAEVINDSSEENA